MYLNTFLLSVFYGSGLILCNIFYPTILTCLVRKNMGVVANANGRVTGKPNRKYPCNY